VSAYVAPECSVHVSISKGGRRIGFFIAGGALGYVVREPQQGMELRNGGRELREVELDVLSVPDELEEVVDSMF